MVRPSQFGLFSKETTFGRKTNALAYELNDFSFAIIYKPGKEQVQLDALFRREQDIPCNVDDDRIAN